MRLFGPLHLSLLVAIAGLSVALVYAVRRSVMPARGTRLWLGCGLAINEIIWWIFRYYKEGFRFPFNLPLQLCDVTVWTSVFACIMLAPWLVEFSYFAGFAGAAMALLTPDLWSPWPSYPAIYFFVAHGGIVAAMSCLVFGRIFRLRAGAPWRAFGMLGVYAGLLGLFDWISGANYMYLRTKPKGETLLSLFGPWPMYLIPAFLIALLLFWILWLAARRAQAGA